MQVQLDRPVDFSQRRKGGDDGWRRTGICAENHAAAQKRAAPIITPCDFDDSSQVLLAERADQGAQLLQRRGRTNLSLGAQSAEGAQDGLLERFEAAPPGYRAMAQQGR